MRFINDNQVLVKVEEQNTFVQGSPKNFKLAKVLKVSDNLLNNVQKDDVLYISVNAGTEVDVQGEKVLIITTRDILAVK